MRDHLGNNHVVANASASAIQSTQYYPFGMAFAEGTTTSQGMQPYKYNGKELDQSHGLNQYDYSARFYDPGYITTPTMDPHSEKFYSWSPYSYCKNNPGNRIDPDGRRDRRLAAGEVPGVQHRGNSVGNKTVSVSRGDGSITVVKSSNENYGNISTDYVMTGSQSNLVSVSDKSAIVISNSMENTGESNIRITSTTRTPEKQANIMYDNIKTHGVDTQNKLYGSSGRAVVAEYSSATKGGGDKSKVIGAMTNKINEIGPQKVSLHCADPNILNVIDIAPSSLSNVGKFQEDLKNGTDVQKVIPYPKDPAVHVEIKQK